MKHRHQPVAARLVAACMLLVATAHAAPAAARRGRVPAATAQEAWNVDLSGEYAYLRALATHAQRQAELGGVAQGRAASPLVRDLAYGLARHGVQAQAQLEAFGRDIELPSPAAPTWLDQHHLRRLRDVDRAGAAPAFDLAYLRLARLHLEVALLAAEDGVDTCVGRRAIARHAAAMRDTLRAQLAYLAEVAALRGGALDLGGALGPVPGDDAAQGAEGGG